MILKGSRWGIIDSDTKAIYDGHANPIPGVCTFYDDYNSEWHMIPIKNLELMDDPIKQYAGLQWRLDFRINWKEYAAELYYTVDGELITTDFRNFYIVGELVTPMGQWFPLPRYLAPSGWVIDTENRVSHKLPEGIRARGFDDRVNIEIKWRNKYYRTIVYSAREVAAVIAMYRDGYIPINALVADEFTSSFDGDWFEVLEKLIKFSNFIKSGVAPVKFNVTNSTIEIVLPQGRLQVSGSVSRELRESANTMITALFSGKYMDIIINGEKITINESTGNVFLNLGVFTDNFSTEGYNLVDGREEAEGQFITNDLKKVTDVTIELKVDGVYVKTPGGIMEKYIAFKKFKDAVKVKQSEYSRFEIIIENSAGQKLIYNMDEKKYYIDGETEVPEEIIDAVSTISEVYFLMTL